MGLEQVQALLKIDEARKDVITYLARVYIRQQADHKMAQDFILKAISINPADVESVVYLADVFIKRQTYSQQSLKIFERAIKAAPEVPEYYMAIVKIIIASTTPRKHKNGGKPPQPAFRPRKNSWKTDQGQPPGRPAVVCA
ncbi:hypothetical protein MASR1M12_19890 [Erysipelotrichia bacterium]